MENSIFKNYINKYFSSTSIVNSAKISFKFISILIYIWFFCLIIMFYRFIIVNIFIIIHLTPFSTIIYDTVGYGSPIFIYPNYLLDIISAPMLMTMYGITFGIITTIILVLFIIWLIIRKIPFVSAEAKKPPFTELLDIFNVLLGETTFYSFAFKNLLTLFNLFLSLFKKKEQFQNFKEPNIKENIYITELQKNYYDKAKKYYEEKNTYLIDLTKAKEHTKEANILNKILISTSKKDQSNVDITNKNIEITKNIESIF